MDHTADHEHTCRTMSCLSNNHVRDRLACPSDTYRSNTSPQIDSEGLSTALR